MSSEINQSLKVCFEQLKHCMGSERFALRRELQYLQRQPESDHKLKRVMKLLPRFEASQQRRQLRLQNRPAVTYPETLPVAQRHEEIIKAIQQHQVVIICGETGSGKTTQLPKMCLAAGCGIDGLIGHTQPRRIAARSVAARIAEELGLPLGNEVGYKVRFNDRSNANSYIKLMTDGILLAEIQQDRFLNDYDALIIDEAHERSLNIDFLMGYLKWLLPKRKDLKLIITSATIDPERFAAHFSGAPIINVSGRTFPVEVRYRPLVDIEGEEERDLTEAIIEAVDELYQEGPEDILVFLPGEREIRETMEVLSKHLPSTQDVLPLFARLSAEEQQRIFEPQGRRRIILSTNVAETSLTVPGIKYVIDTGLARVSRYSWRAGVQRLPIERVSQASANQRSGRCGRVSNGIAIRLYSEEDYQSRPVFTEPEILRTNLASVILQMETLKLGNIEQFPFVEAPDIRLIRDGYKLLFELGAVDEDYRVTKVGAILARLPVDPRFGKMLLTAEREGALKEVLVIVSALAIQDPRERPLDKQQAADEKHARFKDEQSDFMAFLKLWEYYHELRRDLSKNQWRRQCKKEYLSWIRLQEWVDIHYQIRVTLQEVGLKEQDKVASSDSVHRSLLSGLLSNIGLKEDEREYLGANGRKFLIFPGSGLRKKAPQWLMAAELVETSKLFARTVAKIQPEWIEEFASHLIKRHYTEPHWEEKAANVAAYERTALYGITIIARRKISFARIDPQTSRQIFIRHALVYGEYKTNAAFFSHNAALIEEVEALEAKGRRRDILADEQLLYDFFEPRIPEEVVNGHAFERWRKQAEKQQPKLLYLSREYLMQREARHEQSNLYPDALHVQGMILPLRYHFEPTAEDDGVTVSIPLLALSQLSPIRFEYLVPGMLHEKITALIRGLPKQFRKQFVPAPDYAQACMEALTASEEVSLQQALSQQLLRMSGTSIPADVWGKVELADHFLMRFEVIDDRGVVVKAGRNLAALSDKVKQQTRQELRTQPIYSLEKQGIKTWNFGDLPEVHWLETGSIKLRAWPALVDQGQSVAIELFDNETEASTKHRQGVLRLFILSLPTEARDIPRKLSNMQKICLQYAATGKCEELKEHIVYYVFHHAFADALSLRHQVAFQQAIKENKTTILFQAQELGRLLTPVLASYHEIRQHLKGKIQPMWLEALNDINDQLSHLIYPGFLMQVNAEQLRHYPRYLKGIQRRLQKLTEAPNKDRALRVQVQPYWDQCKVQLKRSTILAQEMNEYRWAIEEFRVSLFAQELGTARPISAKRLDKLRESIV